MGELYFSNILQLASTVRLKKQSKRTNETREKETHRYREQTDSCQKEGERGDG